jgi:uncharacterized membrane protein YbhN (UPF0104 family)
VSLPQGDQNVVQQSDAISGASRPAGFAGSALRAFKRHKRIVQAVVLILVTVFLATSVVKSWNTLTHYSWQVRWPYLVVAFGLLVVQEISYGFIWQAILRRLGGHLDTLTSQRIYLGSEFVRYIPGNVWHVITRVLWAERYGVPKAAGFASMVIELATKITSAALLFAVTLFFWTDIHALTSGISPQAIISVAAIGIPLLLLGLKPSILRTMLNFGLRKVGREPIEFNLSYRDIIQITLYWMLSWAVAGIGFYVLVLWTHPAWASVGSRHRSACQASLYGIRGCMHCDRTGAPRQHPSSG